MDRPPAATRAPLGAGPARAFPDGRCARELAVRSLFARDVGQGRPVDVLDYLVAEEGVPPPEAARARGLVEGVSARLAQIDRLIAAYAQNWSLPRLAAVDRNVLRVAVYELLHVPEVPTGAAIAEAVEVAKTYGGEDSGRFVNGVLGQLARDRAAGGPPPN
jgi:N utilization substance protein B